MSGRSQAVTVQGVRLQLGGAARGSVYTRSRGEGHPGCCTGRMSDTCFRYCLNKGPAQLFYEPFAQSSPSHQNGGWGRSDARGRGTAPSPCPRAKPRESEGGREGERGPFGLKSLYLVWLGRGPFKSWGRAFPVNPGQLEGSLWSDFFEWLMYVGDRKRCETGVGRWRSPKGRHKKRKRGKASKRDGGRTRVHRGPCRFRLAIASVN